MWILYKVVVISVCLFMPKVEARVPAAVRVGKELEIANLKKFQYFYLGICK